MSCVCFLLKCLTFLVNDLFSWLFYLAFICCVKHHDQKQRGEEERVYSNLKLSGHPSPRSESGQGLQGGPWRQEVKQSPWRMLLPVCSPQGLLSLLFTQLGIAAATAPPRVGGTDCCRVAPPTVGGTAAEGGTAHSGQDCCWRVAPPTVGGTSAGRPRPQWAWHSLINH